MAHPKNRQSNNKIEVSKTKDAANRNFSTALPVKVKETIHSETGRFKDRISLKSYKISSYKEDIDKHQTRPFYRPTNTCD